MVYLKLKAVNPLIDVESALKTKKQQTDILHESIIDFWKIASYGDLNELKKHSERVRRQCEANSEKPHAQDYIRLVNAIEGFFESNCEEAEKNFISILPPEVNWENKEVEAMARLFCGGNYRSLGQYDKALYHLLEVPRLVNPLGIYATYALLAYYFLGELHVSLGEHKSAEGYYLEGLNFGKDNIERSARFRLYSGLGNLYLNTKEYTKCEEQFQAAIACARPGSQLARSWYDMAVYYEIVGDLEKAIDYCSRSYELRKECNLIDAASTSQILNGKLLMKHGDIDQAITIFEEALQSTIKFNAIVKTQSVYKFLADCYQSKGDWKAAYENFRKYEEIKSNIFSEQQTKFFKIKNEEISRQKELVEMFHGELKDSIRYARRIQQAILPSEHALSDVFPESFLLYKPKDVVSGDFYWIEVVEKEHADGTGTKLVLFAVADCTGHGVPGAMVSIVCVNALNRSVREFRLTEPAAILNKTRELVVEAFEKSELDLKDGMDISLGAFDPETNVLEWSGANNPLYIIPQHIEERFKSKGRMKLFPDNEEENPLLVEIRPDKQPIGKYLEEESFRNHMVQLQKGDLICLFTDGFADQFGGAQGKKFKYRAFKEHLIRLMGEPVSQVTSILDSTFSNWKGNYDQVDDVCVMGIKI